mmetsp:Transcript_16676/g.44615  ORF Transcript_16676/g.44615 Transcript_16676/m.44615 type:complete len:472 (-) Transcript_16676:621-2036(-)
MAEQTPREPLSSARTCDPRGAPPSGELRVLLPVRAAICGQRGPQLHHAVVALVRAPAVVHGPAGARAPLVALPAEVEVGALQAVEARPPELPGAAAVAEELRVQTRQPLHQPQQRLRLAAGGRRELLEPPRVNIEAVHHQAQRRELYASRLASLPPPQGHETLHPLLVLSSVEGRQVGQAPPRAEHQDVAAHQRAPAVHQLSLEVGRGRPRGPVAGAALVHEAPQLVRGEVPSPTHRGEHRRQEPPRVLGGGQSHEGLNPKALPRLAHLHKGLRHLPAPAGVGHLGARAGVLRQQAEEVLPLPPSGLALRPLGQKRVDRAAVVVLAVDGGHEVPRGLRKTAGEPPGRAGTAAETPKSRHWAQQRPRRRAQQLRLGGGGRKHQPDGLLPRGGLRGVGRTSACPPPVEGAERAQAELVRVARERVRVHDVHEGLLEGDVRPEDHLAPLSPDVVQGNALDGDELVAAPVRAAAA